LHTQNIPDLAKQVQDLGAGELVIQSIPHDGMLKGMNWLAIEQIAKKVQIPVIASSGASSPQDFLRAFELGASGVAAGAIFQFTQNTPQSIGEFLRESGVPTRTV
jgi:cyclase